jgi:hypothetical protein
MAKRHIIHFPASTLSILLCCNCTCVTTSASDCIATNILEQYRQWLFLQLHACRHMLIDGCISVMCIIMFSRSGTVLQCTFPAGPPRIYIHKLINVTSCAREAVGTWKESKEEAKEQTHTKRDIALPPRKNMDKGEACCII